MSYKDVSDTQLIKLLEEQGTELCLEAAHRISYYSDEGECEDQQAVPQGVLRYPVVFIEDDKIRCAIGSINTTVELSADQIEGNAKVGCLLVVGDKGKFKVWEPA